MSGGMSGTSAAGGGLYILAPNITVSGESFTADGVLPLAVGGVSDATEVTVTIQQLNNPVSITAASGATLIENTDAKRVVITGPAAAVNATLASFVPPLLTSGDDTITITASDAAVTTQAQVAVQAYDPNTNTVPTDEPNRLVLPAATLAAVPGLSVVTDLYAYDQYPPYTVTLSATAARFFTADLTQDTGVRVSGAGTTTLTLSGNAGAINTALASVFVLAQGSSDIIQLTTSAGGATVATAAIPVSFTAAPAGSAFIWGGENGTWQTPGGWVMAGAPATRAPDGLDAVTLPADPSPLAIAGPGSAASLDVAGAYTLSGLMAVTGSLAVSGALGVLGAGSANSATLLTGAATIAGGGTVAAEVDVTLATWTDTGALQVGSAASRTAGEGLLEVRDGSTVSAASLSIGSAGLVSLVSASTLVVTGTITVGSPGVSGGENGILVAAGDLTADSLVLEPGASVLTKGIDTLNSLMVSPGALFGGVSAIAGPDGAATTVVNNGTIDGPVVLLPLELTGAVSGTGTLAIDAGGGLTLDGAIAATQTVVFRPGVGPLSVTNNGDAGGFLTVNDPAEFAATIDGFGLGDGLIVTSAATPLTQAVLLAGNRLALQDAAGDTLYTLQLDPTQSFAGQNFGVFAVPNTDADDNPIPSDQYFVQVTPAGQTSPILQTSGGAQLVTGQAGIVPLVSLLAPGAPFDPATDPLTMGDPTYTETLTVQSGALSELASLAAIDLASGGGLPGPGDGSLTFPATDADGNDIAGETLTALSVQGTGSQTLTISGDWPLLVNLQTALVLYQAGAAGADAVTVNATETVNGQTVSATQVTVPITITAAPASYSWNTGGSQAGGVAANWTSSNGTAGPPGAADPTLLGPGAYAITGDISTGALTVTGDTFLTGAIYVTGQLSVNDGGAASFGGALYATQNVVVGAQGSGALNLSGLLNVIEGDLVVGGAGTGYLQSDAAVQIGGTFEVGEGASGAVDIGSNTAPGLSGLSFGEGVSAASAAIGVGAGQTGVITVENSDLAVTNTLTVGLNGVGAVQLIDPGEVDFSTSVTANDLVLGANAGSSGTLTVADASQLAIGDSIIVGESGSGTLIIEGQANVAVTAPNTPPPGAPSRESLIIAANAGSTGRVEADGGSLSADLVSVGGTGEAAGGSGALVVQGDADLSTDQLAVGNNGTAFFGAGTTVQTGELDVSGSVRIQDGSFFVRASRQDPNYPDPAPGINVTAGGSITGSGTLSVAPTNTEDGANGPAIPIENAGLIEAEGGTLLLGSVDNTGNVLAGAGGVLDLLTQDPNTNGTDAFANAGVLGTAGGSVFAQNVVTAPGAQGTLLVGGGGTVTLGDGSADFATLIDAAETVSFQGPGTLALNGIFTDPLNGVDNVGVSVPPDALLPAIAGFAAGDTILFDARDSDGFAFGGINGYANGVLSLDLVDHEGGYDTLNLAVGSGYQLGQFQLTSANGGSELTALPCYCAGTRILTARGEVAVELLAIGDLVVTAAGEHRPLKWIGRRSCAGRFLAANRQAQPIRFRAGALGEGLPRRDLLVSPRHAMFLDGILVPAECLVNGVSVLVEDRLERVAYFHLELDSHDVLIAEGALSESFIDEDSRMMFHNADEYFQLYPRAPRGPAMSCAPRVSEGYAVEAIRQMIAARAGIGAGVPARPLRGFLDRVAPDLVEGWAQQPQLPEAPVCLDVVLDGRVVAQTLANRYRPDLAAAGLGSGRHAFSLRVPIVLTAVQQQSLIIRRACDQAPLARSSGQLQAA